LRRLAGLLTLALLAVTAAHAPLAAAGRIIAPSDVVQVRVLNQPELDASIRVAPDGTLSYPYAGRIRVVGMNEDQLARRIKLALERADVAKNAQVIVAVTSFGAQVAISGAVRTAGTVLLDRPTTLAESLSRVGGLAPNAVTVIVRRKTRDGVKVTRYEPKAVLASANRKDNPFVQNGDEIFVEEAQVFYLYGYVNRPGSYPLLRPLSIQQALATGGGISELGSEWRIELKRTRPDGTIELGPADLDEIVRPNDTIIVKERIF
jgi:polysaccharide export outer membrane protein